MNNHIDYNILKSDSPPSHEQLVKLSSQGWYIMQILEFKGKILTYLKRFWNGHNVVIQNYEYYTMIGQSPPNEDNLDNILKDGWELLQVLCFANQFVIYIRRFKKPIKNNRGIKMCNLVKTTAPNAIIDSNIRVGAVVPVGKFFWIETGIGFAENVSHGHYKKDDQWYKEDYFMSPSSADTDCTVRVLAIEDDRAIVVLSRPQTPYGAEAPTGTIFTIPVSELAEWPAIAKKAQERINNRRQAREALGPVYV